MTSFVDYHKSLGTDFFSPVKPIKPPKMILRYRNDRAAASVGLADLTDDEWCRHFGLFEPFDNSLTEPLALAYHGHQFGVYNPDIGDGRGFLFAQMLEDGTRRLLDCGTKGSGQTPYSRSGDGRLTLKGAVREILATEMLTALGVKTSKTLSVIETGEALSRHDEPSPARSAILVRLSHSHIRIGSFQRHLYLQQPEQNEKLVRYVMRHYYPDADADLPVAELLPVFLSLLTEKIATMTGGWMAAGFVHGVLNTDNFNVTGESFDYGPWRFLPHLDPNFTAAYFDNQGRYAYGRQPDAALWALCRLADCFLEQTDKDKLEQALSPFFGIMEKAMIDGFLRRLGISLSQSPNDSAPNDSAPAGDIVNALLHAARISQLGFDQMFFDLYGRDSAPNQSYQTAEFEAYFAALNKADATLAARTHAYFQQSGPVSLVIDEVERLWAPIAQSDDFSLLEEKLAHIRLYGDALGQN
ncbi:MAG: protein adenylyltransferase SelO family protein [Candidatus Puniceispirillaceae bacterium]